MGTLLSIATIISLLTPFILAISAGIKSLVTKQSTADPGLLITQGQTISSEPTLTHYLANEVEELQEYVQILRDFLIRHGYDPTAIINAARENQDED